MALETMVAARISDDANIERNCWTPRLSMTIGTRAPVMTIRAIDKEKSPTREILRFKGMPERIMIGMGKAMRRMSVMMSATPIVMSCA